MALVTVFKVRGIEPDHLERSDNGCKWVFVRDESAQDLLDEYNADEAYVEPREFARKMGLVRSEMYRFLGREPRRVR